MNNRVLTLSEVLALPEETEVWTDYRNARWNIPVFDGVYTVHGERIWGERGDNNDPKNDAPTNYFGGMYRVWSLPQPPTPDELAANPWPDGDGA